jgi:hypothetical protein
MCAGSERVYVSRMRRLLPQTTAAALVLGAALIVSSTGGAVAGSLITGKQIKDGSITAKDVKDQSLAAADFAPDATAALTGPKGPQGPAGVSGVNGVNGANGVTGFEVVTKSSPYYNDALEISFTIGCPAGKVVLGGVSNIEGSTPVFDTYSRLFPQFATSWLATGGSNTTNSHRLSATITCAKVS